MNKMEVVSLPQGTFVLAAVSGGADSVALLALLREQACRGEIRLHAAHFEHGIRGEESRGDARFVQKLCTRWGIECHMGAADVPALAAARGVGLEQAARDARYAFLRKIQAETGADCIALAHHLDDQAETVLMHILRGSGLRGACGMTVWQGDLFRPLLNVRKAELTDYLRAQGIEWREDSTNAQADTPRNVLRLMAMPALETVYPGGVRALGRFAETAAREDDYMSRETARFLEQNAEQTPVGIRLRERDAAHEAILFRALHELTALDAASCARMAALYWVPRGRLMLENGWRAEKTGKSLYLMRGAVSFKTEYPLVEEGTVDMGTLGQVHIAPCGQAVYGGNERRVCIRREVALEAVFRCRRPGDMIRPLGMQGRMKLSDYLINRHVDRPLRDATLLLARGSDVLWVAGGGLSEDAAMREGSRGLLLELSGDIVPWMGRK